MNVFDAVLRYGKSLPTSDLYRKRQIQTEDLQFSSSDYLSLRFDKRIALAYQKGFQQCASGSGGSPVVCGYHPAHQALEKAFAECLSVEDCLLFSSGFAANLALTRFLTHMKVHCLVDKGVHASVYDGIKAAALPVFRYKHNNMQDFSKKMRQLPENSAVLTEGIFSMSGQQAPLNSMSALCQERKAALLVDEAHAFGILGDEGLGSVALFQLTQAQVPLRVIPLGKACAGQGAIIAGLGIWIDALLQSARSFIYSTAMSPALAYGLRHTLDIVLAAEGRRKKLRELIQFFREEIALSSLNWADSHSPIQQLRLGSSKKALQVAAFLQKEGIGCIPMRYPTVSHQHAGLRIILNYHHECSDIKKLFKVLAGVD